MLLNNLRYQLIRNFNRNSYRFYHKSWIKFHKSSDISNDAQDVNINFQTSEGDNITVIAKEGQHLLEIAHNNDIDLEGACEASLACSTCHVILPSDIYDTLPEPEEEEEDMLDLAFGLTPTSRLGCQVKVTKDLDGMNVKIPAATRNMMVDGHKPKPH